MSVETLLEQIPSEVVYRRVPLDDSRNALGPWREAVRNFVSPDDENELWAGLVYGTLEGDERLDFPVGVAGEPVRDLLLQNGTSLQLLHDGIQRGRLQFPEFRYPGNFSEDSEFVVQLGDVAWLPFIRSRVLAAEFEVAEAARELAALLRMGEIVCNGEGQVLHYLIGVWIRKAALRGMQQLARRKGAPRSALSDLLAAVERAVHAPDGLAECLRVDFCHIALPQLDRAPEGGDLEAFVDRLLETQYESGPMQLPRPVGLEQMAPADDRLAVRRQRILALLEGHPKPFDKLATARLMGQRVAEMIAEIERPPQPKLLALAGRIWGGSRGASRSSGSWPVQVSGRFPYVHFRPGGAGGRLAQAMESEVEIDDQYWADLQDLIEADLAAARRKLHQVANPVGLILAEHMLPTDASQFAVEHRKELRRTRKLLARQLRRAK